MRTFNHFITATVITLIAILASCDSDSHIDLPATSNHESPTVVTNPNSLNGHEYVDLGLSVKWATCNIDAQNPVEYGCNE